MTPRRIWIFGVIAVTAIAGLIVGRGKSVALQANTRQLTFSNAAGLLRTVNENGAIDLDNAFFQDLGTNGRACVTCHQPREAWTITPEGVQARFHSSGGTDPIFRNNDGSNCEGALPGTLEEARNAYSLLLTRGLIRVGLDVPEDTEFVIESVQDPYGCIGATNDISVYRRPLPSTNLRFLTAVMWDGRESTSISTILEDLTRQANNATRGHAAALRDLTEAEAREIVEFETGLFSAQSLDKSAASLVSQGGRGGPQALAQEPFFVGINDPVGLNPTNAPFDPRAFTLFDAWALVPPSEQGPAAEARRAIARGQELFNMKEFVVSGVAGLNGETFASGVTVPASFTATCTVCHDSPNVGNHSVKAPLDIGLTAPAVAPYLPVYTLRNLATGETVQTTDPGRAMITGKWSDVNKFKGPILRGLAARAPYFHNGSAANLREAVDFYDTRFLIGLTAREKADLIAFLSSL